MYRHTCGFTGAVATLQHMELTAPRERAPKANMNHTNIAPGSVPRSGPSKALPLLVSLKRGIFNHIDWMSS